MSRGNITMFVIAEIQFCGKTDNKKYYLRGQKLSFLCVFFVCLELSSVETCCSLIANMNNPPHSLSYFLVAVHTSMLMLAYYVKPATSDQPQCMQNKYRYENC
jgi:hypothetical protein